MNSIRLITVEELLGKKFHIPSYQRGYKWTSKQVEDLLDDINDFKSLISADSGKADEFYCLQPLAVCRRNSVAASLDITKEDNEYSAIEKVRRLFADNIEWSVIDGQQRLTTIYLLLCYLSPKRKDLYSITYETREGSSEFLKNFRSFDNTLESISADNVDYFHIYNVYCAIRQWFSDNRMERDEEKFEFLEILLKRTQFIWYENSEDDPVKVFTRLNIGKIGLTNSELIKSLIVSKCEQNDILQIITDWDIIEKQLQNDEFWYFIHNGNYQMPTRIDLLFDSLCDEYLNNSHNFDNDKEKERYVKKLGTDQYRTFRHYDHLLKVGGSAGVVEKWKEVKSLFEVLIEWFNNLEYYHFIGYILNYGKLKLNDLYNKWNEKKEKAVFREFLYEKIRVILDSCCQQKIDNKKISLANLLDQNYETEGCPSKTVARPLLLLHNIQTVINQNRCGQEEDEFRMPVFYRFPFHLYKTQNWDVEHIDSNSTNNLKDNFTRLLWLLQYKDIQKNNESVYSEMLKKIIEHLTTKSEEGTAIYTITEEEIRDKIKRFNFRVEYKDRVYDFDQVANEIRVMSNLPDNKKNRIGNFTLLDASTNRGYGNSIFPAKRKLIMAKERCRMYRLSLVNVKQDESGRSEWNFIDELDMSDQMESTFIPPVTKNVFMKYYTPTASDFTVWNENDFLGYKEDIALVLQEFLKEKE